MNQEPTKMTKDALIREHQGQKFIKWGDSPVWVRMGPNTQMWDSETQCWISQEELEVKTNANG